LGKPQDTHGATDADINYTRPSYDSAGGVTTQRWLAPPLSVYCWICAPVRVRRAGSLQQFLSFGGCARRVAGSLCV